MAPFVRKPRFCRRFSGSSYFKPQGISMNMLQVNELKLDELEAIHWCDFVGLEQKTAAEKMKVSTSTLQRLLYSGRKKIIDAIYNSKALKILRHDDIKEYIYPRGSNNVGRRLGRGYCRRRSIVTDIN